MSDATQARMTSEFRITYIRLPLGANIKAWQGTRACGDTSVANVVPAKTSTTLVSLGEFAETVDNTGGAAGALHVNVKLDHEVVAKWYASVTGANAVTAANLFSDCYWADNQTVTMLATGASKAGRVWAIDATKGVAVEAYTL